MALQMQWPPVGIHAIGYEGRALVMSAVLAASYYSANVAMVAREPKVGERGGGGGGGGQGFRRLFWEGWGGGLARIIP